VPNWIKVGGLRVTKTISKAAMWGIPPLVLEQEKEKFVEPVRSDTRIHDWGYPKERKEYLSTFRAVEENRKKTSGRGKGLKLFYARGSTVSIKLPT